MNFTHDWTYLFEHCTKCFKESRLKSIRVSALSISIRNLFSLTGDPHLKKDRNFDTNYKLNMEVNQRYNFKDDKKTDQKLKLEM